LLKTAKEEKQLNVVLKTIESFENNLGLNTKVKVTETRKFDSNDKLISSYKSAVAERDGVGVHKTQENMINSEQKQAENTAEGE
jgi:hypothetical protein